MGYGIYVFFFKSPIVSQVVDQGNQATQSSDGGVSRLPGSSTGQGSTGGIQNAIPSEATSTIEVVSPSGGQGVDVPLPEGQRPSAVAHGGPTLVSPLSLRTAVFPNLSNGKAVFYDKNEGKFYRLDPKTGDIRTLSDKVFSSVENVTWSPQGTKAVLEFPDKSKVVYDFDTGKQNTIPKEWTDFSFSNTGQQLAFQYVSPYDTSNNWLAIAGDDGSNIRKIEPVGDQRANVAVNWKPTGEIVATFREGKDVETQEVTFIGLNDENYKSLPLTGRGFEGKWSNDGSKILYSVYNSESQFKPTLWVASASGDALGQNRRPLEINTWPSKCVFGKGSTVYCAVPKFLDEYSGVYKQLAQGVPDDLYAIDLSTGSKTKLAELVNRTASPVYSVQDLLVDEERGSLYFTDASTGQLNEVRIR